MRSKKLIKNVVAYFVEILFSMLAGFLIPRAILERYGSNYNGLVSTITQFLELSVLLRAGVGGATMVALYKPLAENNIPEISRIVKTTEEHMRKIGLVLAAAVFAGAFLYPVFIDDSLGIGFTASLFIIIGISSFAENFWGITYYILLSADQKIWITSVLKSIFYISNTVASIALIRNGFDIRTVKACSSAIFILYPLCLRLIVIKNYHLNLKCKADPTLIKQKWDAFFHQLSNYIMNNTDIVLLSIFTDLFCVSVYSVYHLVIAGVKKLAFAFSSGLESAYGNMIAKNEMQKLKDNVGITETLMFGISTILYPSTGLVILDFVRIYTRGISDTNYYQPAFSIILTAAFYFYTIRIPYQFSVQAAGKFKETKKWAIMEPILNIAISVVLIRKYGLIGVAVGTLAASVFRTVCFSAYMSKEVIHRPFWVTLQKLGVSLLETIVIVTIVLSVVKLEINDYYGFIIKGVVTVVIASCVVIISNLVFWGKDVRSIVNKLKKACVGD